MGVAGGLAAAAVVAERTPIALGGIAFETLHLTDATSALFGAILLRVLAEDRALAALSGLLGRARRAVPGWGGRALVTLVAVNLLLIPHSLGHSIAQAIRRGPWAYSSADGYPPPTGVWESTDVRPILDLCLARVPPDGRILLVGSGIREFEPYLLAFALYPRPLFMHREDEAHMELGHAARLRVDRTADRPTAAGYREMIGRQGIAWVLFRDGRDPRETRLVPTAEAFR